MTHKQRALPFAALALLLAASGPLLAQPRPTVLVEAVYPGASAQMVADTVAAPIEQQVRGVEKMAYVRSRCSSDGWYTLTAAFAPGTDLDQARALIQKRANLALPVLPQTVKRRGVAVRKQPPGVLLIVCVSSPGDRYDSRYLGNYADIQCKDELARLPGVRAVALPGRQEYGVRVWLDLDLLASRRLTAADVVRALRRQNLQAEAGRLPAGKGKEAAVKVNTLGRLANPERLAHMVLKTDAGGRPVRLRDVGRVEVGAESWASYAWYDGKPVVLLTVAATQQADPREVSAAVRRRLARLGELSPAGVRAEVAFDFSAGRPTAPEYLLLDVALPLSAAAERTAKILRHCAKVVKRIKGVQDVLAMTENLFGGARDGGHVLLHLARAPETAADRERLARAIRARLAEQIGDAVVRLRWPPAPGLSPRWDYPIDLAVHGPDAGRVRALAKRLAERLTGEKKLTDVWAGREGAPRPQLYVDIDREQVRKKGVKLTDLNDTLTVYFGALPIGDFQRFGRTWHIRAEADGKHRVTVEDIKRLQVRNARGEMVPLATLVTIRDREGPAVIDRLDGRPMVEVTAKPAAGVSLAEARRLCESLAGEARQELRLSAEYRLTWLRELPAPR